MRITHFSTSLSFAAALLAAAVAALAQAPASNEIRIGQCAALTGPAAALGQGIAAIQERVAEVGSAISGIAAIVQEIDARQTTIIGAVDRESVSVRQIAQRIQDAAGCRGDDANPGLSGMVSGLVRMAEEMERNCPSGSAPADPHYLTGTPRSRVSGTPPTRRFGP